MLDAMMLQVPEATTYRVPFPSLRSGKRMFGPGTQTPEAKTRQGLRGKTRFALQRMVTEKYPGMPRRDRRKLARLLTANSFQLSQLQQVEQMVKQASTPSTGKLWLPRKAKPFTGLVDAAGRPVTSGHS